MRSPHNLNPGQLSLNLTPMIDVVFLLIIFFLVSSQLIQQETGVELNLPTALTGKLQPDEQNASKKEIINILPDGSILLRTQPTTLDGLREYFLTKRVLGDKDAEVVIRTDKDVPYGKIEPILVLCAKSGIWKISYDVIKGE